MRPKRRSPTSGAAAGTLAVGLLAIGVLPACARPAAPAPAAAVAPTHGAADATIVSLERRPCYGTCPVYTVTLDGTGAVRFEGRRFVADTGVSTGVIPAARVDSLAAELEAGGYFGFADRYLAGQPECPRYATDLPTVITELHVGGRIKRVEHDRGCADAPAALSGLERRIDEVAGVGRWTGK